MGGKSSSSSTTSTQQYDQRVGATDGGVAIGAHAQLDVDMTSPEAWEFGAKALDFGQEALDIVNEGQQRVLEYVQELRQSEETTLARQALKLALPVAVIAVAVAGLRGVKVRA